MFDNEPKEPKDPKEHSAGRCPIQELLSRLGDKWSLLVICSLSKAPNNKARFSELMRSVNGISQRMLTTTLRHLERDGILSRHLFPEVPPRVEYALTERGKGLLVHVGALVEWVHTAWPEIQESRAAFDAKTAATADAKSAATV